MFKMQEFIRKPVRVNIFLVAIAVLVCVAMRKFSFGAGILVGASWIMANFLLTINLLEIAILKRTSKKLLLLLLIKFPVLYISGFLIVFWKLFPTLSLLTGMSIAMLVLGVSGIWLSKRQKLGTSCQI
jgi:hypothetical protein